MISPKPVYVVDLIGDVVERVKCKFPTVNYQYGHFLEIANTLVEWSKGSFDSKKYPLIALFQDFSEVKSNTVGIDSRVSLHILIATRTQKDYKAEKRYEVNFKPILYPIYYELMHQLQRSNYFQHAGDIPHTKIDRLYWGTETIFANTANNLNDYADCIEIQNLELNVKPIKC